MCVFSYTWLFPCEENELYFKNGCHVAAMKFLAPVTNIYFVNVFWIFDTNFFLLNEKYELHVSPILIKPNYLKQKINFFVSGCLF